MIVIDSNLIIYAAQPERQALRERISTASSVVSAVSRLETFGYHSLKPNEVEFFGSFFSAIEQIPIEDAVLDSRLEGCESYRGGFALIPLSLRLQMRRQIQ